MYGYWLIFLRDLGAVIDWEHATSGLAQLQTSHIKQDKLNHPMMGSMRASFLLAGLVAGEAGKFHYSCRGVMPLACVR